MSAGRPRTRPESEFIRGPIGIEIPVPLREAGILIGYEWKYIDLVELLNKIPKYSPFTEAEGYYFCVDTFKKFMLFVIQECVYPEGEYCGKPFIPEIWQWAIYANIFCWKHEETNRRRIREAFIFVPRKNGKELRTDTPIPTPDGFTNLGDIKVGDTVFDKDGIPCKVVFCSTKRIPEKTYKITFSSKHSVEAGADHQWHVFSRLKVGKVQPVSGKKDLYEGVVTTQQMFDAGVDCCYGKKFHVQMHNGIETKEADLPIDPYILGSWLGDGTARGPYLTVGKQDINHWPNRPKTEQRKGVFRVTIDELRGRILSKLNLRRNKHIPEIYFTASRQQRLSLLQGLMDTDGTISKRGTDLSIVQKSKVLADGIVRLLYSLGLKASITEIKKQSQNKTEGTYYRVQFAASRNTHPVFRLRRKLDRMKLTAGRSRSNHIVSIEPCQPSEMMCIQVDSPSSTYLFGEQYLPTHNTVSFGMVPTLWEFFCGEEKRAQLYCCAADIEQASVNFRHSMYNIETNKRLLGRLLNNKVNRSTRSFEHKNGKMFKVLSSIADTKHGLSPSFVYADEIHAHKNSELIDVMITGMGARPSPLLIYTTTSDYDRDSYCNRMYERAVAVRDGIQSDPTFLPVIYEASVTDDYRDPKIWEKANPNFGKSIYPEYFKGMLRTAEQNPAELAKFLRLNLNIRTKTETAWISPYTWNNGVYDVTEKLSVEEVKDWFRQYPLWYNVAAGEDIDKSSVDLYIAQYLNYWSWHIKCMRDLTDEECYGGFDNASTEDIASFSLFFPAKRVLLGWCWTPADSIYKRAKKQKVPYDRWYEAGLINRTALPQVDEEAIVKSLIGDGNQPGFTTYFRGLREVCFDRWKSNYVFTSLEQYGINARAYPQNFNGMNEPCRFVQKELANKSLWHGGNPVLDWMVGNVTIQINNMGQQRPTKEKSVDKIDMVVSSLMAIGGHLYPAEEMITEIRGLG